VKVAYYFSRDCLNLGLRFIFRLKLQFQGKENLPDSGPCILIANHLSFLDPIVVGMATKRQLHFLARQDLFNNFFFGCWLHAVGVIALKRDKADISALKESIKVLKRGGMVALFPEGTRQEDPKESFSQIKRGFLLLARQSQAPIVVAKIYGSEQALPRGATRIKKGTGIKITLSKPFYIDKEEDEGQTLEHLRRVAASL
jgi:1-acyl-sn-glycerol-3-phosphate acyltransferase